ncbi:unnamed protein product [Neospora caninum Liverpool]|uniref:Ras-associated protein Rap1 isoform 1 family protein n=1 Tax=Neospora caninum (strain Liverpool) TaxID=572307 RepID=F0V785_NEOCL|nr:uncharacterized protein NCLIV_000715 [Neospora caninum Liverpool]CBZ49576.1 unnamed protein product [Neospora caninum Liverpool]CEL64156.1 TPA: Ras-associated protein Rap1 isoform 1 family protein [Neospora caninum Liverpool]|eukprot:XP_003879611.1 uncharacterized protein NCLIV_000715 [Neospora caninum Liverpool]
MSDSRTREGQSFSDEPRTEDRSGPIVATDRFYDLLQLSRDASHETVKKTYRQFALLWHPDKGGDVQRFQALTAAWEVLGDETRRRAYDRSLIRTGSTDGLRVGLFGKPCSEGGNTAFSSHRRRHSTEAEGFVREPRNTSHHEGRKREDISSGDSNFLSKDDFLKRLRGEAPRRQSYSFSSPGNAKTPADPEGTEKTKRTSCRDVGRANSPGHISWNNGGRDPPHGPRKIPATTEFDTRRIRQSSCSWGSDDSNANTGKDEATQRTGKSRGSVGHYQSGNPRSGKRTGCVEEALREVLGEEQFKAALEGNITEETLRDGNSAGCSKHLVKRLNVKQLKRFLTTLGIPHQSCIEKTDLLEAFSAAFPLDSPSPTVNFSPQVSGQKEAPKVR